MNRPELPEVASSIRDEWRVLDARGETESITTYARVAWEVAAALHKSTVWHRQVRIITTPWRQLDPRPVRDE
jgi:hypothetical protein